MGAALCLLDLPLHRSDTGLLGLPCCLPPTSTQTKESLKRQSLAHHYFTLLDASNVIRTSAFDFSSHVRLLDLVSLLNSRLDPAGKNFQWDCSNLDRVMLILRFLCRTHSCQIGSWFGCHKSQKASLLMIVVF